MDSNEQGEAGDPCWETYTPHAPDSGKMPGNGYVKSDEGINGQRNGKYWMPAECDVPLREGWFYHKSQDSTTKTPDSLLNLYYESVGRGACLDLGLSPNTSGNITDVLTLKQFGNILHDIFSINLANGATLTASNIRGNNKLKYGPSNLLDADMYTYWATDDTVKTPNLVLDFHSIKIFNIIRLREDIKLGQRIEGVSVDAWKNETWVQIAYATSIGGNRLIRLGQDVSTSKVRIRITKSPVCIALSDFGLFEDNKNKHLLRLLEGELK
jgi:alpha-L-fucosidase